MDIIILNIIGAIAIAVTVLIISNRLIIKRALEKFIIPDLTRSGHKLNCIRAVGFLQNGKFKKEKLHLRPFTLGYPVYFKYVNLYYSKLMPENIELEVTVRISVFLFVVYKVEYSHSL